ASSNNASSNNASSNNASSNNASSNNASSNNASSNNASSNNASSKTFTAAETAIINSPGQSNYQDEKIFEELAVANVVISNQEAIEKIYTEIEAINRRIKEETSAEVIAQLTDRRNQLTYEKMQEEDKNASSIAEHNSNELIDLQSAWKKNTSSANSIATLNDKKAYDNAVAYMKEASTLRAAAKAEPDIFERYAKNARAFALERNAKNELEFLVEKTTPSANNASSNNASSNNASSNNASSNNASSNNASSNNASSNNASSNNASSNNASSNNASSNNASSNNASSFTSIPKIVQRTLYQRQTTSVYSDTNPIPIGLPLPEGSFYTIQVGAFRLPVANNTFNQFAPVYAERQTNGFIRYRTGFFTSYTEAIQARNDIRQMGYADAFIVAYKNRERVRYSELMTAAEKASTTGGSTTPPVNTSTNAANADVTYYSDPLAVPANLIEKTEGVFFTVQVGVYGKPSRNTILNTYSDLHVEKLQNGQIRYTSGKFQTIPDVIKQRDFCRANGIPDAFITAYKNGKRITVPEAKKELGIQ
ncbi:MAG: SPOR domain-containing protein, partial [Flavobacteriales bacterium]|nr:SPOR domain-containing protein [Flavobacteriales bacterium]